MPQISKALPVQFWDEDAETFNEKEIPGRFTDCFCLPWNSTDTIPFQFIESEEREFLLRIYDENDQQTHEIPFDVVQLTTSVFVYKLSIVPADLTPAITDQFIRFRIVAENIVSNASFNTNTSWTNIGTGGSWTIVDNAARVGFIGSAQNSKKFTQSLAQSYFGDAHVEVEFEQSATANVVNFRIGLGATDIFFATTGVGVYSWSDDVAAVPSFSQVDFEASSPSLGTKTVYVRSIKVTIDGVVVYFKKSDYHDIRESHDSTYLITFTNGRNYAGLIYNALLSPSPTFTIRIPMDFHLERFPEEDEDHDLSNNETITLSSELKAQRLMSTDHLPPYVIRMLLLILKHQTLLIDTLYWTKKDAHEQKEGNKRFSGKRMEIWLTEKDFVERNVVGVNQ